MKKSFTDYKLIGGILLAYILIYVSFDNNGVFWYLYTATMLFLISIAILSEKMEDEASSQKYFIFGLLSGISLYILFFAGDWLFSLLPGSFDKQITKVYSLFSFKWIWHYLVLFFIIIPGEEIFWRGFVQKRLTRYMDIKVAILIAATLNAAAYILSGFTILIIAAFISGIVWGSLYVWKRSMPLIIISHLIFDLLLLIIWPLG
ncbi:CPBP family intramembrane glutamic endopeptidase [Lederbergia lenta]|uniref:Abortive infection protein n=1 Tax=Lederbergia lenta TaxID=1467 RepID=A0A2X4WPJ8_LEDLE|nr:type II CAAX endopeptidase family protein [Lederbergia lenta]MCM3110327.1 CPBP family intramembrane metalloprotease [Lederbergia lenta]MEC2324105.1 type II CAAX endopeptidase family protein [Lederbergia lenta]SQI60592.1 abortive infection protein [Lederbergia lenta]